MANVTIDNEQLTISIGTLESVAALQGSFTIPLTHVRGASEDPNYAQAGMGIRSPGTGFPGLVAEGTFHKDGDSVLSLWHRGQEIVVIEIQDSKWDRLVIGCDDARALTDRINAAIAR